MKMWLAAAGVVGSLVFSACSSDEPTYELDLRLAGTADAGPVEKTGLGDGVASLKNFACDVSIRLGQCIDARPVQLVIVPADRSQSGSSDCGRNSAKNLLRDAVAGGGSTEVTLGRGDGGTVWIQAFHGDDDDDSGLVDRAEMNAYAELVSGTLTLTRYDDDRMEGTLDATDATGGSYIRGTLGAANNDDGSRPGVGPRCTWPIGATAD